MALMDELGPDAILHVARNAVTTCRSRPFDDVDVNAAAHFERSGKRSTLLWIQNLRSLRKRGHRRAAGLMPRDLAEGWRMKRDVSTDRALNYSDFEMPSRRPADALRVEQTTYFSGVGVTRAL
jgi:hypothetical protein